MIYGYARVSTVNQSVDRQVIQMLELGILRKNIYIDKQSGSDFERVNYQKLLKKLKQDDILVIKSIDRLGRNYQLIIDQWYVITKIIRANIKVIDMPLLDTSNNNVGLIGKLIGDIVLQILSYVAENEKVIIKQRQAEGIKRAKENGIHMGRPKVKLPINADDVFIQYKNKAITLRYALSILCISKTTFFKYLNFIN